MSLHPILIAAGIIVAVAIAGYVIAYFRDNATVRGYEELLPDVISLSKLLKAERFRDGNDLVVSGNYGKFPTVVRFSYDDNTPGLNIRMKAPSTFTLSVVPKGAKASEGRVQVRTTDEMFDARFVTRTDHPTQARMFLSGKQATGLLQKLCCSSKTFFTVVTGSLELSELVIPSPYTGKHVSDHLDSMGKMAKTLAAMPGADAVKITPYRGERNLVVRTAMAVLVVTGIAVLLSAVYERNAQNAVPAAAASALLPPAGVSQADLQHLPGVIGWRVATSDDFDANALAWLQGLHSGTVSGHLEGNFTGTQRGNESAYVFIRESGQQAGERRLVILDNNQVLMDAGYKALAIAAIVPKENFAATEWQDKSAPAPPDGDGVLIVRDANDPKSGVVLYASGGKLATAQPASYQSTNVE
ncbi:MAG TPA: hypothetical protein VGR50_02050 [Terriglobales bacterium]|nr:hypothetical protein [Terriglobales bacterium]